MSARAANAYRKVYVESAQPSRILDELYAGLLADCRRGAAAIRIGDLAAKGAAVSRAIAIVGELQAALDHGAAPDLCRNLAALYMFVRGRLRKANLELDVRAFEEIERVVAPLREGFQRAAVG
jgi:flagellar secretion chaperone FliS